SGFPRWLQAPGGGEAPCSEDNRLESFLAQWTYECRFSNAMGQEQVHFFDRYIYDRQEIVHFDSTLGRYEAVTPLGEPAANYWNSQKELVHYKRSEVDRFCRHNFQILGTLAHARRVQPTVTISPTKDDPLSPHTLLLCTAASFYPQEIEIRWLKNGRRATEGVFYGEELHNGDWTYQTQVMLEDTPQRGDIYACQVEHSSLETLLTVQWGTLPLIHHQSRAAAGIPLGSQNISVSHRQFYVSTLDSLALLPSVVLQMHMEGLET
uniref:Ig-like domain-containing protein n=1 Tax=Varanus komodoensis TaxID=61221 RepID=A0A8D2LPX2_VARKO